MDPASRAKTEQWFGRMSYVGPHSIPLGGMQAQDNLQCVFPGKLTCRKGLSPITSRATYDIISLYHFQRPEADWLVWENTNGDIKAAKLPALSSPVTIRTGLNIFQPVCFAKGRNNVLLGVNGIDRPFRWDGLSSTAEDAGIDAPAAAPTITMASGGAATAGAYLCAYRYVDDDLAFSEDGVSGPQPSSLSTATTVTATANQKFQWSVLSSPATAGQLARVTKVQGWRTTSDEETTFFKVWELGSDGSISGITNVASTSYTITSTAHSLLAGAVVTISGVVGSGNMQADLNTTGLVVVSVTANTFTVNDGTASGTYTSGGSWLLTGYNSDVSSDATLEASTAMLVTDQNGRHLVARRFTAPPDYKPFIAFHQDRAFYAGSVEYTAGTVTTNGSTTLTGSSTNWVSNFVGRFVYIQGETLPFTVSAFTNSTTITLSRAAVTSSGSLSYAISPSPLQRNLLGFSEVDEPESVPITNTIQLQENTGDDDEVTGIMATGYALTVTKERHIISLQFFRQPEIDADPNTVAHRGCLNNRVRLFFDGAGYYMDTMGIYQQTGSEVKDISKPIHDLWSSCLIDFTVSKWFFASIDPVHRLLRFHVSFVGDSSTRPTRWLEFNPMNSTWTTGSCLEELGGAVIANKSGQGRSYAGGQLEVVFLLDEGNTDVVSAQTRGTLTACTSTLLTDSTANFGTSVLGATVAILDGNGKYQFRKITARSSTTLTVSALSPTPAVGSSYLIGAVPYILKTGIIQIVEDQGNLRYAKVSCRVVYQPTATAASLDIRRYINHDSSAYTAFQDQDLGTNITMLADSADGVVNLLLTRSAQAYAAGFAELKFGNYTHDRSQGRRWFTIEIRGFQGDDLITIHDLEFDSTEVPKA